MENETRISLRVNKREWEELGDNINTSKSQFIRDCIKKQNEKDTDIQELRKKILKLENEKKIIECEIKDTKELIYKLDKLQEENENNKLLLMDKIDIIKNVASNENGITEKRIKTIANNEIKPHILINECKKQGIKIITENERKKRTDKKGNTNVKVIKETKEKETTPLNTIVRLFNRRFNSYRARYGNNKARCLKDNENDFKIMCKDKGINFNDFKEYILKD